MASYEIFQNNDAISQSTQLLPKTRCWDRNAHVTLMPGPKKEEKKRIENLKSLTLIKHLLFARSFGELISFNLIFT